MEPSSKEDRINEDYLALNTNIKQGGTIIDQHVKVHFIRCLTPQMNSLNNLLLDLTLFKKGQTRDKDTLAQMEQINRQKLRREELRLQNDKIALKAFRDLQKLKGQFGKQNGLVEEFKFKQQNMNETKIKVKFKKSKLEGLKTQVEQLKR